MPIHWKKLPALTSDETRARLARHAKKFDREHRKTGAIVDMEVFAFNGMTRLPGGTYDDLVVPKLPGSILVEGDLEVRGVLEQPFGTSPLLVEGKLAAGHVVTTAQLVVMGDAVIGGTFYGNCTNFDTVVYGGLRAQSVILEKNHHFAVHGKLSCKEMLDDEEDGYDATAQWMEKRGVERHDARGLAKVLRSKPAKKTASTKAKRPGKSRA